MKQYELENVISFILEDDIRKELTEWYEDMLEGSWEYVVFTVRRSYVLALIMEKLTGKKMEEESHARFLTDASIILHCEELAEAYKANRRFPMMLLCDDMCIHGRNTNHFMEMILMRLCFLLPEYDEAEIKEALLKAIRIHVYVRKTGPLVLMGSYEFNLRAKRRTDARFVHNLSSDLSRLILCTDIANASYIFSERLTAEKFADLDLSNYISTRYQNVQQYAKIMFVGDEAEKKAIFSLRIIKNPKIEEYRILPFVFMPNLGEAETNCMLQAIENQMRMKGVKEQYIERIRELEKIPGKRTFNELVTLLFSQALLQEFNNKYKVEMIEEDKEAEIRKLARNYDRFGLEDAKEWIGDIVFRQLFTLAEVEKLLNDVIASGRKMIYIDSYEKKELSQIEEQGIKMKLERYFYERGMEEEREAYELSRPPYYASTKRSARAVRGCGFLLWDVNMGYAELEAKYSIAYFLQMMDAGVLSLSSFATNHMKVVGFAQFAKTGEQSLLSEPLKFSEWIPMLTMLEHECEWRDLEFQHELDKYGKSAGCDLTQEQIEEIKKFVESLFYMHHKVEEWMDRRGHYLFKKEIDFEGMEDADQIKKISKFLDLQLEHMSVYEAYRRNS